MADIFWEKIFIAGKVNFGPTFDPGILTRSEQVLGQEQKHVQGSKIQNISIFFFILGLPVNRKNMVGTKRK